MILERTTLHRPYQRTITQRYVVASRALDARTPAEDSRSILHPWPLLLQGLATLVVLLECEKKHWNELSQFPAQIASFDQEQDIRLT